MGTPRFSVTPPKGTRSQFLSDTIPAFSPGGETGRHKGLKIPRRVIPSCRFDPCPGHQFEGLTPPSSGFSTANEGARWAFLRPADRPLDPLRVQMGVTV